MRHTHQITWGHKIYGGKPLSEGKITLVVAALLNIYYYFSSKPLHRVYNMEKI